MAERPARSKKAAAVQPPKCACCDGNSRLTTGAEIYPHREDLHSKKIWACETCESSYVGCHGETDRPLGRPADAYLRDARAKLHGLIDPIWSRAELHPDYNPEDQKAILTIRSKARSRVYLFLADRLGLSKEKCHIAEFDLETCRDAWRAMRHVEYDEVRQWDKARKATSLEAKEPEPEPVGPRL